MMDSDTRKHLSLLQLNSLVRELLEVTMPGNYWVEAEIASINERGGHCYMELVEKSEGSNTPVAKAAARCWRTTWSVVKPYFLRKTGKNIVAGMKVLLNVRAQFHENYGFSWIVNDIDPNFTIGDMFAKRQKIIALLKAEGMFDANRQLDLPLFTQRIAVISSPTAAGYGDFCNHLASNEYGYFFKTTLFEAVMQGEGVESSVVAALERIYGDIDDFDCVVITRGGGATSDLSGFDALDLARNVANFPIPVITAIGHDRDESVLDMVSNTRVKTPTAAAAFLIDRLNNVDKRIDNCKTRLVNLSANFIDRENMRVRQLAANIMSLFTVMNTKHNAMLDLLAAKAANAVAGKIKDEKHKLDRARQSIASAWMICLNNKQHHIAMLQQKLEAADPMRILERGYTMTLKNGKVVASANDIAKDDVLVTRFKDGSLESKVL